MTRKCCRGRASTHAPCREVRSTAKGPPVCEVRNQRGILDQAHERHVWTVLQAGCAMPRMPASSRMKCCLCWNGPPDRLDWHVRCRDEYRQRARPPVREVRDGKGRIRQGIVQRIPLAEHRVRGLSGGCEMNCVLRCRKLPDGQTAHAACRAVWVRRAERRNLRGVRQEERVRAGLHVLQDMLDCRAAKLPGLFSGRA